MGHWTDLAAWRGPTNNQGGAMAEHRGVVIHIAEGGYEGTISWQRNPSSDVSSHFIVAKDGRIAQMVDTDTTAWTQRAGNGHWLSVENEGHTPNALTPAQIEANARILAKAHRVYGVPLQLATSASGRGLGHHSMGGSAWGHLACPGPAIIAQKPAILARAKAIINPPEEDDVTRAELRAELEEFWREKMDATVGTPMEAYWKNTSGIVADTARGLTETRTWWPDKPEATLPIVPNQHLEAIKEQLAAILTKLNAS